MLSIRCLRTACSLCWDSVVVALCNISILDFRKEYNKVSQAVNAVKEAFETDGCTDSGPLNNAMAETSKAYADIAIMFQQQVSSCSSLVC